MTAINPARRPGRRMLVIHNPTAGARRRRRLDAVVAALRSAGVALTVRPTGARGDAEALAKAARAEDFDLMVVAGGDGTINEAINGHSDARLPLALVPLGTANVLALEVGLSTRPEDIVAAITAGRATDLNLGRVNGRRFAVVAGVGFDARSVARVGKRLKRATGKFAYVVAGLAEFLRLRPTRYVATIAGRRYEAAAILVANARHYAGRFVIAPDAGVEVPVLHVCLLTRPGRWHLLRYVTAILLGRLDRLADVTIVPATDLAIDGPPGDPVEADGDIVATLPVTITVERDRLFLVCPRPAGPG